MDGQVKRIVREKGFGFIRDDSGQEWFFHHSGTDDFDRINEGDLVTFNPTKSPKGPRAEQVRLN